MSQVVALQRAPYERARARGMMVATKTVTVTGEDGSPERLKAGQTFVVRGHWLVETYPDLFVPEQGAERARSEPADLARELQVRKQTIAASPVAAPAALNLPLPSEPKKWKPLVRLNTSLEPTFTVNLSGKARDLIGDLAFSARGEHETGGGLFGPPARKRDGTAEIRTAGEPGPRSKHEPFRITMDLEHIRREAGRLQRMGSDARWVGSWHTHPSGNGEPSPPDLEFFAWDCREQSLHGKQPITHYVALILTPTRDCRPWTYEPFMSWIRPNIHAWHVRAVSDDQFICRRAAVAERRR
jgi:proteasome lid subunit RPN8/RPN11